MVLFRLARAAVPPFCPGKSMIHSAARFVNCLRLFSAGARPLAALFALQLKVCHRVYLRDRCAAMVEGFAHLFVIAVLRHQIDGVHLPGAVRAHILR